MKDNVFDFEKSELEQARQRAIEAEMRCDHRVNEVLLEAERQRERQSQDTLQLVMEADRRQKELSAEIARLDQENDKLRMRNAQLNMKLEEMSKLSARVAQNTSEDNLLKALRTYINNSKRKKKPETRVTAKQMVLDFAAAHNLSLPPELEATLESLDDKVTQVHVTVHGNYNDIHDNGTVNFK